MASSPAPTDREQVALKVFGIPELAHLICDITQKRDHANLMQVCRELFHSTLPFVWKEVDRPDILVSMIPGGGIVTYESEVAPYVVMHLPASLDLSRFSIYAPHVKRLTLSLMNVDAYDDWERFLACTRSVDLLPNLETIYFPPEISEYSTKSGKVETDSVNWAIAFLSSSLQTLLQAPLKVAHPVRGTRPLWLDWDSFDNLMTSIAQKCPRLSSLSVLPAQVKPTGLPDYWGYRLAPRIVFACDSPETYSSFLQLSSLTTLLISAAILCPEGLDALSGLPRLESLYVVGWENDLQVYGERLQIPTEAFPALRHLELNRLTWDTVFNLCSTKPLVNQLQSLSIMSPYNHWNGYPHDVTSKGLSDVIPLLATHSPSVTTLTLHDYGCKQPSPELLNVWKRLPLVSLQLGWTVLYGCGFDVLCSILSCLPLLESLLLSMIQEPFELEHMRTIVELLPRLRRLQIPVRWDCITQLTGADFTPCRSQTPSLLRVTSNFHLPESQEKGASQLARLGVNFVERMIVQIG
ncbi:unnamed protein product [Rhizoctonia solani]|uniref:Uncharacterized protein n=1 Tax=Rhizoctonia solani TaxID=456999 RepID=A0A8H2XXA6_9AGAM|nr:unnamed protein product [Rhizoctonia solani]CAE6437370.1 unnamed protein product [Rhizoctonia solani]